MKNPLAFWVATAALLLSLCGMTAHAAIIDNNLTEDMPDVTSGTIYCLGATAEDAMARCMQAVDEACPGGVKISSTSEATDSRTVPEGKHVVMFEVLCRRHVLIKGSI